MWSLLHMLREISRTFPCCSSTRCIISRRPTPIATSWRDRWKLNLVNLRAAEPSPGLWQTSTDACCARHKVEPLFSALEAYDVWFTGLRRQQSASRANLPRSSRSACRRARSSRRVSPLAAWTTKDVWMYAKAHDIPLLPLYELGYTSIGCEPCTSLPLDPTIRDRAAGRARSWNAGSTSSPDRHYNPCSPCLRGP